MSKSSSGDKKPEKPKALVVRPQGIPAELRELTRWVVWRFKQEAKKDGKGKWKKPPFDPITGKACTVTDPGAGSVFRAAVEAYATGRYDGVGLVLRDDRGPEYDFTLYVLDIDDCRDKDTGTIEAQASAFVSRLDSYTEVSPSGTGVHVFFYANLPTKGRRVGSYELYAADRYMTVTGTILPGSPVLVEQRPLVALNVCYDLGMIDAEPVMPLPAKGSPRMSDDAVLAKCRKGPGSAIFAGLWQGDRFSHKSDSEADLSFCARLSFYTQDEAQIARLWKLSRRWREKCESDPRYVRVTIQEAIRTQHRYYDPNFRSGKPGDLSWELDGDAAQHAPPAPPQPPAPPSPPPHCVRPSPPAKEAASDNGWIVERLEDLPDEELTWLIPDWIARGSLTLVCGRGDAGKSTFLAWVASFAKAALLLPGHEESLAGMLKSRCRVLCPNFPRLHFINSHNVVFPGAAAGIIRDIKARNADVLLIDPVDNYTEDRFSDTDPKHVRDFLESLTRVAHETGAAVVGVRHSAKGEDNPLPGSRNWRNVPRRVIELVTVGNPVTKRYLRLEKNSYPAKTPDTYYDLVPLGDKQPCRFVLRGRVSEAEAFVGRALTDRVERSKVHEACRLLRRWLANGRVESRWANEEARKENISPGTLFMARKQLGVESVQEGGGTSTKHYFVPPEKWPEEGEETNTVGGGDSPLPPNG